MRFARDERGLIGKVLVLWIVLLALVVIAAIDGASILMSRVRTADLARDAAVTGAEAYARTGERAEARDAALAVVEAGDEDALLEDLEVTRRGEVTVVVTDETGTLLVGRFGILDELIRSRSTATSGD